MERSATWIVGLAALVALVASSCAESGNAADALRRTGMIAFERIGHGRAHLFVVNADGSDQRELTSGSGWDSHPDWSPDGKTIVYAHEHPTVGRRPRSNILAIEPRGRGRVRVTNARRQEQEPDWSPRGRAVAFIRDFDLYVTNLNGTTPRRLTRLRSVSELAWSPDGTRIAFSLWKYPGGIRVINADGSGLRRLRMGLPGTGIWSPVWSPDGRKLAFQTGSGSGPGRIFVIDIDGSHRRQLTRRAAADAGLAWSPDGRKIIYERARGGGIYAIDGNGTHDRRLTRLNGEGFSWSPDAHAIAFSCRDSGHGDIYVMNPDGSGPRRLTHTPEDDSEPIWSPKRR